MNRIGLKLWSVNSNYLEDALKLFEQGIYDYIELYAVPDSYNKFIGIWKDLNIPFIIHAPHSFGGLNPSLKSDRKKNKLLADETIRFADILNSEIIIFHPGIGGLIEETAFQLNSFNDKRIIIENKPYYTLDGKQICLGYSPEQIKTLMNLVNINFCFDIGHCIYSANAQNIKPLDYIKKFLLLSPAMYHLSDGDYTGTRDRHDHYGMGNFPLPEITNLLLDNIPVSIETEKSSQSNLSDFAEDVTYFRSIKNLK